MIRKVPLQMPGAGRFCRLTGLSEISSKSLAVPRSRVYSCDKQNKNGGYHENCEDCGGHSPIWDGHVIFERVCKRGRW
jgi:hypothetical protein